MTIEFPCNNCLQPLRVPDTSAGKGARCPKCKAISVVPTASALPSPLAGEGPGVRGPAQPSIENPPPPAAPSPNDALFAMLKAATTPLPPPPPQAPPAANAFVDATRFNPPAKLPGGPPGVNPYASPTSAAYAYQPTVPSSGERPGLPWEVEGPGIMSWWHTSQMCLSDSSHAFHIMRREGGIGSPLLFAIVGMGIGFLGQVVWRLPVLMVGANLGGPGAPQQDFVTEGLIEIGVGGAVTIVAAVLLVPIYAVMYHLTLMMFGGASQSFETTYRVVAYTHGALAWLQVVPCVGGLIVLVMHFVCLINGLAEAHDITRGKAAAAVFLPLGLCLVAIVGIAAVVIGAIAAQG
jgi:hypothetical protein